MLWVASFTNVPVAAGSLIRRWGDQGNTGVRNGEDHPPGPAAAHRPCGGEGRRVSWALFMTAAISALLGFAAGLLTFKRSSRWCPDCGKSLSCPACGSQEGVSRPPAVVGLNRGVSAP